MAVGDKVAPDKLGSVFDISIKTGAPGVDEDLINFLRVGGEGVWFGVVIGWTSCVRDLIGVFVLDGLVSFFGVLIIYVVVLLGVKLVIYVSALGDQRSDITIVALELSREDEGESRVGGVSACSD